MIGTMRSEMSPDGLCLQRQARRAESHAAMVSHVPSDRRTVGRSGGPRRDPPANHGCRPVPAVITSGPGRWFGFALTQVTDAVQQGLAALEGPGDANREATPMTRKASSTCMV